MKRTLTLFLCAMGFCFQVALSDTVRVTPDDDMYTDPDNPTGHSQAELWTADWAPVNNFQRICMRFDLAEYEGHEISSATLKLYRFFGCPTGEPTVTNLHAVTQSWTEEDWPEDQHLQHDGQVWASHVFSANGWAQIDLRDLCQAWCDGDLENFGLVIVAEDSKFSKCYSKEAPNAELHPYLEIEFSTAIGEPAVLPKALGLSAYPNPFNCSLNCELSLQQAAQTKLSLVNLLGVSVAEIFEGRLGAGNHSISFTAEGLPSGNYILLMEAGENSLMRPVLLVQ